MLEQFWCYFLAPVKINLMFNQSAFEKSNHFENRGSVLEHEYFNTINRKAYGEAVDQYQHPELYTDNAIEDIDSYFLRKNAEKSEHVDSFQTDSYINFKDAMNIVEECQPGNPEAPSAFFAGALRKEISNLFGEEYKVQFFTAVGSHLDTKHGVDAFIKLLDKEGKELAYTTLDISGQDKGSAKADQLIMINYQERDCYDSDSASFDKDKFLNKIKEQALEIQKLLIEKQTKQADDDKATVKRGNTYVSPKKKRPRIARHRVNN